MASKIANLPAATSLPTMLPLPIERGLERVVSRLDPPINPARTAYGIAESDAPSPDLRRVLDGRMVALDAWLRPAGPVVAAEQAAMMLDVMALRDADPDASRRWAAIFVSDLMGLPGFAVVKACTDLRRGTVGDGKWVPEPGVVCTLARKAMAGFLKERREIDAALTAEVKTSVPDPVRKAALLKAANKLAGQMSMNRAAEDARLAGRAVDLDEIPDARLTPEARRERAEKQLAELKDKPLPKLSPYLAGKLGLLPAIPELEPVRSEDAA